MVTRPSPIETSLCRSAWSWILPVVLALAIGTKAMANTTAADTLQLAERIADWQLSHPCAFDVRWRAPGDETLVHVRLGWDGTILRHRPLPFTTEPDKPALPTAWNYVARREAGNLAFNELPDAARKAWIEKVALDPQHIIALKLMDEGATRGWEMATLYVGLLALDAVSANPIYREALRTFAEAQHWQLAPRPYHADDLLLGYLHLDFYQREKKPEQLAAVQSRLDWLLTHPSSQSLDIRDGQDRWTWCDALFMAPPVWLRLWEITGDRRYLDFMDREWWATTEFLFSKEDALFFRDAKFFTQREANGEKIFWSRGNAWVIASLALMLEDLPADLPSRPHYVELFQALAHRLSSLQPDDGLWRSSLLDPHTNPNPESSATAFFCYAFARGIRLGMLDEKKYRPIVDRTWSALRRCVQKDGRVGFVQQPGAAPGQADASSTAPYGVGAFLLAGTEVYRLQRDGSTSATPAVAP